MVRHCVVVHWGADGDEFIDAEINACATAWTASGKNPCALKLRQKLRDVWLAALKHPTNESSFLGHQVSVVLGFVHRKRGQSAIEPKLSDGGGLGVGLIGI